MAGRIRVAPKEQRTYQGVVYASKGEMIRYMELELLLKGKLIRDLRTQVEFPLHVNGQLICTYVADFVYLEPHQGRWVEVVEDFKGMRTDTYRLKKRLMSALLGVQIRESGSLPNGRGWKRGRRKIRRAA
jgi:hypothetical protein